MSLLFLFCQTGDVILTREAHKLRKETGDTRYRARVEDERTSLRQLISTSCTRPLCGLFFKLSLSLQINLSFAFCRSSRY